jgi:hypothetical protein
MPGNERRAYPGMAHPRLARDQKKARRHAAEIVFVDETAFSFQEKTATTWASLGQIPILRRVSNRRELSTVVGLTLSGKIYKHHVPHAIGGVDMLVALQHFQRHIPGPMSMIWDRSTTHRATIVKEYFAEHPRLMWNGSLRMPRI